MHRTDCIVIGAGQAGLAMSRCLTDRAIDHVVLERGRIAERWRSERWDSLRLLTPNWQSRLPGFSYDGPDPDGYMTMGELVAYLHEYARHSRAPVEEGAAVERVVRHHDGFRVETSRGWWKARAVVVATGHSDVPFVPPVAARVPATLTHVVPTAYRRPSELPAGGVLVVGASASGIQLADEIHASGRPVTIAVGHHTRLPRRYRGRDILWWLDRMGVFDETVEQVYDVEISREQPSLQLVGHPDHRTLDLATLQERGVRVVGRLLDVQGGAARFDDDLVATTAASDVKLASLLARIDRFVTDRGLEAGAPEPFVPSWPRFTDAETSLSFQDADIDTIVWATGFRRHYPWLHLPVLDARGEIQHRGGVTAEPGLYVLGLHFLRRRKSSFIDGVGDDAQALASHIAARLRQGEAALATGTGAP
jgi:putative flavoprotein involved in K+ transport